MDDRFSSSHEADNWDLIVIVCACLVAILAENKATAAKLTAAGRVLGPSAAPVMHSGG
jgi:hypothetical protein